MLLALTTDGRKIIQGSAVGPAVAVSVAAGAAADIDIPIPLFELARKDEIIAIRDIIGLPSGLVLVGFSSPNVDTVRLRVHNVTTAAISVAAGSITVTVEILGT